MLSEEGGFANARAAMLSEEGGFANARAAMLSEEGGLPVRPPCSQKRVDCLWSCRAGG